MIVHALALMQYISVFYRFQNVYVYNLHCFNLKRKVLYRMMFELIMPIYIWFWSGYTICIDGHSFKRYFQLLYCIQTCNTGYPSLKERKRLPNKLVPVTLNGVSKSGQLKGRSLTFFLIWRYIFNRVDNFETVYIITKTDDPYH